MKASRLRRFLTRTLRALLVALLAAIVGTLAVVLPWRWIPPPTTAFIVSENVFRIRHADERRARHTWVPIGSVPAHVALAVVASEDQRFSVHWGIDPEALRDALGEGRHRGRMRGASTLTQQTAKNLYLWRGRSWFRKGLEAYLAVWVDLLWPKRRILEVYLNFAELGDGVYGIEEAARGRFGIPAARLSPRQACLLAASLPNPRRWARDAPPPADYVERAVWIRQQMDQLGGVGYLEPLRLP